MNNGFDLSRRELIGGAAALGLMAPRAMAQPPEGFEVWMVRHGESQINVAQTEKPGGSMEPDDGVRHPLTVKGIDQVNALARQFGGMTPSVIYASTRLRAIQTADAISMTTRVPITPAPQLVEVDVGSLGSASGPADSFAAVYRRWLFDGDLDARLPGGESRRDVEARALPFLRMAIETHRPAGLPMVVVAHGALMAITAPHIFANVDHRFAFAHPIANTGIVRGRFRDGKLVCTHWSGEEL